MAKMFLPVSFCFFLFCTGISLQAQPWGKYLVPPPSFRQIIKQASEPALKGLSRVPLVQADLPFAASLESMERISAINTALEKARRIHIETLKRNAHLSVLAIEEDLPSFYAEDIFTASSFVIEEEYQGRKYLWGVTASHIAKIMTAFPSVHFWRGEELFPIRFEMQGNMEMADLALFPIPKSMASQVKPLPLAPYAPQTGEPLFSFGFFDGGFHLTENRIVKEVSPSRIVTSLEFHTHQRGGACGGPVLNSKGEVVGIHVGSSTNLQSSYVTPSWHLQDLIRAYRNQETPQILKFNGIELGEIHINEAIQTINALADGHVVSSFHAQRQAKNIDYEHLEKLLFHRDIEEIHIYVSQEPLILSEENFPGKENTLRLSSFGKTRYFLIKYNLQTGNREIIPQTDSAS